MAAADLKPISKMTLSRTALFQLIFLCFLAFDGVEAQCTLPEDMRGTWVDSVKGSLEFGNHTITGYDIFTFGQFTLTCYNQNGSTYIVESDSFYFFSLNFTGYMCWSFTKVNDDLYYFYEYTAKVKDAGYEKVKMYLPTSSRVTSDICYDANPSLGTYRILYRNDTLSTSLASASCPSLLQKYFTFDMTRGDANLCSGSSSLDGCSSTSSFAISSSNCTTDLAYSAGGSVSCLLDVVSGTKTYMTVVNNDATVDDNSTFTFTCMIMDSSASPYQTVQYPTQCPDDTNVTYVYDAGAYVTLTFSENCPTITTSYLWVIGLVVAIILLIAIVVFVVLYRKKKQDGEMKKKLELERAGDDCRYTGDENLNTRGKYPLSVTIAIMEGRSRGLKDMRTEDKEKGSFRTSGDVTPSGIQPSYDAPHRKFSKRRRVWVIGEDGSVVKEWKESRDGRDSPDSGVENEEERRESGKKKGGTKSVHTPRNKEGEEKADDKGQTKTGNGFIPATKNKEQEEDFQKQYGRQDVRAAGELMEREDMSSASSKLFSKIKRMTGIKSFAMVRKKRSRGAEKSVKMYKHKSTDDGQRHSSNCSDNGNDDNNDENITRVVELKPQRSEEKEKKGDKKSGKGRDSPDSGTGRDSALSSHSSSSSSSSPNNDRSGGGAGGIGGGVGDKTGDKGGDQHQKRDNGNNNNNGKDKSRGRSSGKSTPGPSDSVNGTKNANYVHAERSGHGFERSARNGGPVSRSQSKKSGLSGYLSPQGGANLAFRSSGNLGSEYGEFSLRDISQDQVGDRSAKGDHSGSHVTGSGAETPYYGAGHHDNVLQVTPRGEVKDLEGGGSNGKRKRKQQERRKREESTVSAIDITNALGSMSIYHADNRPDVETGRSPTGHQRRHGWQDGDSSRSPSRSRSRSPGAAREKRREGWEDKDPAPSEGLTESRSVHWQEGDGTKPGTAESGRRSVRWQDGNSQGDSLMIPLTSGMGIRRYPDTESGATTPSRDNRAYGSLSRLARIHKKKKAVAPMTEDPSDPGGRQGGIQRPPDLDDLEWKRLLEELYPDKKYLDYAKATSEKRTEEDAFMHSKAEHGLHYLHDRARFWKTQEPLVRPGTSLSFRSVDSRACSAVPPPSRGGSRAGV